MEKPNKGTQVDSSGSLCLVVLSAERVETHPLPDRGEVDVGRSFECGVRIDHASVSRRHARIIVEADALSIEDLESTSGTQVRGAAILAGRPTQVAPGELIELGGLSAMVQRRSFVRRVRPIVEHDYFMQRAAVECRRARAIGAQMALVRVHLDASNVAIAEELASALRGSDLVGEYAPNQYELLLADTPSHRVAEVLQRLRRRLESGGARVHFGTAMFPRDGRHADALLDRASEALLGVSRAPGMLIAESPTTRHLHGLLDQYTARPESVHFVGPPGAGKTALAERLHRFSSRSRGPLQVVDAAVLSPSQIAAQLDHVRALSGATLLIENISSASVAAQEVMKRGLVAVRAVGVRVLSTGEAPIEPLVAQGQFSEELRMLACELTLEVVPLAERRGEIEPLARHFARAISQRERRLRELRFRPETLARLRDAAWPGNLTQLRNVLERAACMTREEIEIDHLPADLRSAAPIHDAHAPEAQPALTGPSGEALRGVLDDYERRRILEVLQRYAGNQTRTARALGISRRTLVTRLSEWGMTRSRKR